MIIKLTRRSKADDYDKQIVYINTDNITNFYTTKLMIHGDIVYVTNINMTDSTITVEESAEYILHMIQPVPLYADTDALTAEKKKRLYKLLLNGMYGTVIHPRTVQEEEK